MDIRVKRVYEPATPNDGYRVLVDGIWPRGVSKSDLAADEWRKELAPSKSLRQWFGHDPDKWDEFQRRYREELAKRQDDLARLRDLAGQGSLTLLYAARDENHNNALALKRILES